MPGRNTLFLSCSVLVLAAVAAGCNLLSLPSTTGANAPGAAAPNTADDAPGDAAGLPAGDAPPELVFTAPAEQVVVPPGASVDIAWSTGHASQPATVTVFARAAGYDLTLVDRQPIQSGRHQMSIAWNTASVPPGLYTIGGLVTTPAGRSTTASAAGRVLVDPSGGGGDGSPYIVLESPGGDVSPRRGDLVEVTWNDGDMSGYLVDVYATHNGREFPLVTGRDAALDGFNNGTVWDTSRYPAGAYQFNARLRTPEGDTVATLAGGPLVPLGPNALPIVKFQWPAFNISINEGTPVTTTWTVQDDDVTQVRVTANGPPGAITLFDGLVPASTTPVQLSAVFDTTLLPLGDYTITATADDAVNPTVTVNAPGVIKIIPRVGVPPPPPTNVAPTLTLFTPGGSLTFAVNAVNLVTVSWADTDPDNNARITIKADPDTTAENGNELIVRLGNAQALNLGEDADGPADQFTFDTSSLSIGTYRIYGSITDNVPLPGRPVLSFAPGVINIVSQSMDPGNVPPSVTVSAPQANRAVVHNDLLVITYTFTDPDATDAHTVTVLLDKDRNPLNDSLDNNDANGQPIPPTSPNYLYILDQQPFLPGVTGTVTFVWTVNISAVPPRTDVDSIGRPLPYFVRVTVDDGHQDPSGQPDHVVSGYANGSVTVQAEVQGIVDLRNVGRSLSGAVFQGFTPNSFLGGQIIDVARSAGATADENPADYNQDGADDFVFVANGAAALDRGPVGQAFMVFGRRRMPHPVDPFIPFGRMGDLFSVNSIKPGVDPRNAAPSEVPGAVFFGPAQDLDDPTYLPSGITAAASVTTFDPIPPTCPVPPAAFPPWVRKASLVLGMERVKDVLDRLDDDPNDNPMIQYTVDDLPYHGDAATPPTRASDGGPDCGAGCKSGKTGLAIYIGAQSVALHCPPLADPPPNPLAPELIVSGGQIDLGAVGQGNDQGARFRGSAHIFNGDSVGNPSPPNDPPHIPPTRSTAAPNSGFGGFIGTSEDINRDGLPEFLFSAPRSNVLDKDTGVLAIDCGVIIVYFGADFTLPATAIKSHPAFNPVPDVFPDRGSNLNFPPHMLLVGGGEGDQLGGGTGAGDFNQDSVNDLVCGAPKADRPLPGGGDRQDNGIAYVVFGSLLTPAIVRMDDPNVPHVAVIGTHNFDEFGTRTARLGDINGDGIDDVAVSAPKYDFNPPADFDNGLIAILFGDRFASGEIPFTIDDITTPQLPGCKLIGPLAGGLAGTDIRLAGDFNNDGFNDLIITAPGEQRTISTPDPNNPNGPPIQQVRRGIAYLVFGGPHLTNKTFFLSQVGSPQLPGLVIVGPSGVGSVDEAPVVTASGIGDVDGDGFDDVAFGIPAADFVNPAAPTERRVDAGEVYVLYGNGLSN